MKVKMVNIGLFTMRKVKNFTEAMKIVSLIFQRLQDFSATQHTGRKIKGIQIVNLQCGKCLGFKCTLTWALRINHTLNMMSDNQQTVIIIRQHKGIGIDSKLNGWNLETETMLDKKYYNGRICFQVGNKRVGLTTLRKEHPCKIIIPSTIPF